MTLKTKISMRCPHVIFLFLLILIAAVSFSGCIDKGAAPGDTVKVDYTVTVDGVVRDSSYERGEPLEFVIGDNSIVPGFSDAVIGMKPGEKKSVPIPPEKGYGLRNESDIDIVSEEEMTAALGTPAVLGETVYYVVGTQQIKGTVTDISNGKVTIDFNHELAGKTLNVEFELIEIVD